LRRARRDETGITGGNMAKQVAILGREDVAKLLDNGEDVIAYVTVEVTVNYDTDVALGRDDLRKLLAADHYDAALNEIVDFALEDDEVKDEMIAGADIEYDGELIVNGDEAELWLVDETEDDDLDDDE
jgi:hypothetical protein